MTANYIIALGATTDLAIPRCKHQPPDYRHQTPHIRLQALHIRLQTSDTSHQTTNPKSQTPNANPKQSKQENPKQTKEKQLVRPPLSTCQSFLEPTAKHFLPIAQLRSASSSRHLPEILTPQVTHSGSWTKDPPSLRAPPIPPPPS